MQRDVRAFLWDVQNAADAILAFTADLDVTIYAETDVVHSAVERKFEIIGEALNQLTKLDPALSGRIPDIREVIAFRNVLIHGYAAVDHERVWRTVRESLPGLRAAVAALLAELSSAC
jgi:uncharacterized protein with HEPN domain